MSITTSQRERAISAAQRAVEADRINDTVGRNAALVDLWVAVGYWLQRRTPTTAEFRGERTPPKMIRMPKGPSKPWSTHGWTAAITWAAEAAA